MADSLLKPRLLPNKNNRLLWWYTSIADYMLANPGGSLKECARQLGRCYGTVARIAASDMFRAHYDERRRQLEQGQNFLLRQKLTGVAEASLDIILETINVRRTAVPLPQMTEIAKSALDRLGYSPTTSPAVQVNLQNNTTLNTAVVAPVTVDALEKARQTLRIAQERRASQLEYGPILERAAEPQEAESEVGDDLVNAQ